METENDEGGAEAVIEEAPASEVQDAGETGAAPSPEGGAEEGQGQAEQKLPPLSAEEYQKRHENVTKALRDERLEKRQLRNELQQLRDEFEGIKTGGSFERQQVDKALATFANVDWEAWYRNNPAEAEKGFQELQQLAARKDQLDKAEQERGQQTEQQRQQRALQELGSTLQSQEDEYRRDHPDYDEACNFLKGDFAKEAEQQGYFGNDAVAFVNAKLIEIGMRVNAAGKDMAEFGYNMAVQRGYKPKQADIASIKAGEGAARTLSTVGAKGAQGDGGESFEEKLGRLNGAAARDFWEKFKREQRA